MRRRRRDAVAGACNVACGARVRSSWNGFAGPPSQPNERTTPAVPATRLCGSRLCAVQALCPPRIGHPRLQLSRAQAVVCNGDSVWFWKALTRVAGGGEGGWRLRWSSAAAADPRIFSAEGRDSGRQRSSPPGTAYTNKGARLNTGAPTTRGNASLRAHLNDPTHNYSVKLGPRAFDLMYSRCGCRHQLSSHWSSLHISSASMFCSLRGAMRRSQHTLHAKMMVQ